MCMYNDLIQTFKCAQFVMKTEHVQDCGCARERGEDGFVICEREITCVMCNAKLFAND
jgi:hypothetical protein